MSNLISASNKFLIVISGPTGVGKSDLAIRLAQELNAEIFSADSRQIYKEMTIGTAKPTFEELSLVPHHFINHVSIFDTYSAGHYELDAKKLLHRYFQSNAIGILVGGTGLYIKALLNGLDNFPKVDQKVIDHLEMHYKESGLEWLQNQVRILDPDYYHKVDLFNSRRLIRALSVVLESNSTYTSFLEHENKVTLPYHIIEIGLDVPRELLYERINKRVDSMISNGLVEEASLLYQFKNYRPLETVGYQELFQYFDHEISKDEAIELIKQNSRRYAKRQITWFKKHGNWKYFKPDDFENILDFINEKIAF
jgi:tRNA dimethylallyltransferase